MKESVRVAVTLSCPLPHHTHRLRERRAERPRAWLYTHPSVRRPVEGAGAQPLSHWVTYQGHFNLRPGDVGHCRHGLYQCRGEEEVVVACGRQVQGHRDVEGQREHREIPLAEDGIQGARKNWAEDGRNKVFITVVILRSTPPRLCWPLRHLLSPLLVTVIPGPLDPLICDWE